MKHRSILLGVLAAALSIASAAPAARAQHIALQDKPFAEHKVVLQLSDNDPKKQGLVISVANNLMKFYDPDKVAVEDRGVRPGHRVAASGKSQPQAASKAWSRRARGSISASTPSTRWSATPASVRTTSPSATPVQVGVAQILFLTENGYTLVRP